MILCLIFLLGALIYVIYNVVGKTLTSPSIIFTFSLFGSACVSFILEDYYGLTIGYDTLIIIIIGSIAFFTGEYFSRLLFLKVKKSNITERLLKNKKYNTRFKVKRKIICIYSLIGIITIVVLYNNVTSLAASITGGNIDSEQVLMYAQMAKGNDMASMEIYPFWMLLFQIINTAICFVSIYCFSYNTIIYGVKFKETYFLIPVVVYIIMSILMMSRSGLIELVVYEFTLVSILWKINYGNMISNKKILKYGCIVFIVFMMLFFYMRFLRGGGEQFDLVQDIFAYAGSEIPGMDAYLKGKFQFKEPYDEYVGSHTFLGLYYFLHRIGFDIPPIARYIQFVFFNNAGYTNVYTIFTRYILDFGLPITILLMYILGLLYGCIYNHIVKNKDIGVPLLVYASIVIAVYYSSISEMFFSAIIHPIYIGRLILICIFYNYVKKAS